MRELSKFSDVIYGNDYVSLDLETTGLTAQDDIPIMAQMVTPHGEWVIDLRRDAPDEAFKAAMMDRSVTKILHNGKFDGNFLKVHYNIEMRGVYDTMIAERLLLGTTELRSGLAPTLNRRMGISMDKTNQTSFIGMKPDQEFTQDQIEYGIDDVIPLKQLMDIQLKLAEEFGISKLVDMENRVVEVLIKMETNGIGFDTDAWLELAAVAEKEAETTLNWLNALTGNAVANWNSPKQVKEYFADNGFIIESLTDLPKIKNPPEGISGLIEYKKKSKLATSFGKKFLQTRVTTRSPIIYSDTVKNGRIHASFNQIVNTGRLSCSKPNLQQIPKDERYRKCFVPREGFKMAVSDFTAQELAVIAVGSGEQSWIDTLMEGGDLHGMCASVLYGHVWDEMTDEQRLEKRGHVKAVNFSKAYGASYKSVAEKLGITAYEGKVLFNDYDSAFPKVAKWMNDNANKAKKEGYTLTLAPFNRIRNLSDMEDWKKVTIGKNSPIQGTGADIGKLALCMLDSAIIKHELEDDVFLVGMVHDEIMTEVRDDKSEMWAPIMQDCMEKAAEYILKQRLISAPVDVADYWIKG